MVIVIIVIKVVGTLGLLATLPSTPSYNSLPPKFTHTTREPRQLQKIEVVLNIILIPLIVLFQGVHWIVKGKGYHGAFAALGILSLIGLLVIRYLPDRYEKASGNSGSCPSRTHGMASYCIRNAFGQIQVF